MVEVPSISIGCRLHLDTWCTELSVTQQVANSGRADFVISWPPCKCDELSDKILIRSGDPESLNRFYSMRETQKRSTKTDHQPN